MPLHKIISYESGRIREVRLCYYPTFTDVADRLAAAIFRAKVVSVIVLFIQACGLGNTALYCSVYGLLLNFVFSYAMFLWKSASTL